MSLIKSDFVIYLTGRIPYLGKFLLLSFNWKDFQKIRLQDTLIITTSWWNYWITGIQACPSLHIIAGGAQRLLKTNSFTENSIEWKIMWKYIYIYIGPKLQNTPHIWLFALEDLRRLYHQILWKWIFPELFWPSFCQMSCIGKVWVMDQKAIHRLDCMILQSVVSL